MPRRTPEPSLNPAADPVVGLRRLVPIMEQIARKTTNVDDDAAVAALRTVLAAANPRGVLDALLALAAAGEVDTLTVQPIVPRPPAPEE